MFLDQKDVANFLVFLLEPKIFFFFPYYYIFSKILESPFHLRALGSGLINLVKKLPVE